LGAKFVVGLVDVRRMASDPQLTSTKGAVAVETHVLARGTRDDARTGGAESATLAARSAQALIFGAGLVTLANTVLSPLRSVNVGALRVTGAVTVAVSFVVPKLPWAKRGRLVSYGVVVAVIAALVATDRWHHYSRNDSAIAVYPIFFILVIAWAGLTQPRGTATIVAVLSGGALAWLLASGGHGSAAWQCIALTVPAAAILGEVVSWAYGRAVRLGRLDAHRRTALEALVSGASRLQGALTADESEAIVVATATVMFGGHDAHFENADQTIDAGPEHDDAHYEPANRELRIRVRGQAGVLGTLTTIVDQPDSFLLDAARLYSQHIGTRLEQLRVIDALTDAATHDALTGLPNRRVAQASIQTLHAGDAVFILDLDHFKTINDSLGHQTGDQVLATFGNYLSAVTRPTDAVARYGGEEFLLISPGTTPHTAHHIANRLLDGWRAQRPLVTFSIGYTIHTKGDPATLTIEHADAALYAAKREGRDRAHPYLEPSVFSSRAGDMWA
jgi:diguanylate cyclase (GGDEF)-like protein